jgi:hypothetical protein
MNTLEKKTLVPRQRTKAPLTANDEIGWYAQNYVSVLAWSLKFKNIIKPTVDYSVKSAPITQWNADYVKVQKINPFKIKKL